MRLPGPGERLLTLKSSQLGGLCRSPATTSGNKHYLAAARGEKETLGFLFSVVIKVSGRCRAAQSAGAAAGEPPVVGTTSRCRFLIRQAARLHGR